MKFHVFMKTPDALDLALNQAVVDEVDLDADGTLASLSEEELAEIRETRGDRAREVCKRWFRFGESVTLEIDTDDRTCRVLPC